ncbi:MAG: serine hydrolase [Rhodospirillales bacterium]|nr:MAG: serine hydrolase [Rhodospirillales bacterium]
MTGIDQFALERRIDAIFAKVAGPATPGAVVGIMRDGDIVLTRGYGLASVEHAVPVTPRTRFRIASVSKQFTVTAALMLESEGRLALDAPPHRYLPELPALPITIDQMMRNCSGWPDFLELTRLGGSNLDKPVRPEDLDAAVARCHHLNFEPGSRFLYSNTNFLLLGRIVERIAGAPLGAFLAERVFKPLGMTRTALVPSIDTPIPDLATGYVAGPDGAPRRAGHAYPQGGEGGLTSTVEDLLIWSRNYDRPALAPRDLATRLTASANFTGGLPNRYRRGVEASTWRGFDTIDHGGLWPGYRTEFLRIPDAGLTVVVIVNLGSSDPAKLARAVAAETLRGDSRLAPPPAPVDEAAIRAAAGLYASVEEISAFELAWRDGEAVVTQNGIPFTLANRGDGWLAAERGSFDFAIKAGDGAIDVDLGAGRVRRFAKVAARDAVPADLAGAYRSADVGATWTFERRGDAVVALVAGPLFTGAAWPVRGLAGDLIEIETPGTWLNVVQHARIVRDAAGKPTGLLVSTGRIKNLPFDRV